MMKKYLRIKPANDAQGCLQDIHWYSGTFGYFPCYTLGAIIAAQLMAKYKAEHKDYSKQIKSGNFKLLTRWLKEKVHKFGSYYLPDALVEHATGEKLNTDYFIKHLKARYQS
jgi:carboxypeptidase Taq